MDIQYRMRLENLDIHCRVGSSKSKCQTARGTLYINGQEPAKLKFLDPVINGPGMDD